MDGFVANELRCVMVLFFVRRSWTRRLRSIAPMRLCLDAFTCAVARGWMLPVSDCDPLVFERSSWLPTNYYYVRSYVYGMSFFEGLYFSKPWLVMILHQISQRTDRWNVSLEGWVTIVAFLESMIDWLIDVMVGWNYFRYAPFFLAFVWRADYVVFHFIWIISI